MHSPSQIVYLLAGSPPVPKGQSVPMDGPCLVCGFPFPTGVPEKDCIPSADSDRESFASPYSEQVCSACAYTSAGKPPDNFRQWSIVYAKGAVMPPHHDAVLRVIDEGRAPCLSTIRDATELCLTNRGLTSPVTDLLLDPPTTPWFISLANSGQIHTLRFAKTNSGRTWVVRLERSDIFGDSGTFALLLYRSGRLKQLGFSDEDIFSGEPNPATLYRNPTGWFEHIEPICPYLKSGILELALWCHTKDSTDENVQKSLRFINP